MFSIFLCVIWSIDSQWTIKELPIYRPLKITQVALTHQGTSFLLDVDEQRMLQYSPEGVFVRFIGRKGTGPGEFQNASALYLVADKLYVFDLNRTHVFTLDGLFVERGEAVSPNEHRRKLSDGWLVSLYPENPRVDMTHKLLWRESIIGQEKVILTWESSWAEQFGEGRVIKYNPVREQLFLAYNDKSDRVFIKPGGVATLYIFDVTQRRMLKTIPLKAPRIPFDSAHGEHAFLRALDYFKKKRRPIVKDFPEYYPSVTSLRFNADGYIALYQTTSSVHRVQSSWLFDQDGHPVKSTRPPEVDKFIAEIRGNVAYVCSFDTENEIAGYSTVPIEKLESVLATLQKSYALWYMENYR